MHFLDKKKKVFKKWLILKHRQSRVTFKEIRFYKLQPKGKKKWSKWVKSHQLYYPPAKKWTSFACFVKDINVEVLYNVVHYWSTHGKIYTRAQIFRHTETLIFCVLHLEVAPWKVASSCSHWKHFPTSEGFFWELAHIQEHSDFTAVLQRLNAAYGTKVPLFHH